MKPSGSQSGGHAELWRGPAAQCMTEWMIACEAIFLAGVTPANMRCLSLVVGSIGACNSRHWASIGNISYSIQTFKSVSPQSLIRSKVPYTYIHISGVFVWTDWICVEICNANTQILQIIYSFILYFQLIYK